MRETCSVDSIHCPYCDHNFCGMEACNYDMAVGSVKCPSCAKEMEISISVQYTATAMDGQLCVV